MNECKYLHTLGVHTVAAMTGAEYPRIHRRAPMLLWPIVLAFLFLWLMGFVLGVSGAYLFLVIAAILAVLSLFLRRKRAT